RESLATCALRGVAMHQFWKVEPKLVTVALGVRTLDFAQLALKARVHDGLSLGGGNLPDITLILIVEQREQRRKRIAVLEAQPATVANLKCPFDFFVEPARLPVLLLGRIVGQ